jgi:ethanolamine utilization cobalamin adenosyltransferase
MEYGMGPLSLRLNLLRTCARETELAAVTAFRDPEHPSRCLREDIVTALNRLSSLLYILIYKYLPAHYSPSGSASI